MGTQWGPSTPTAAPPHYRPMPIVAKWSAISATAWAFVSLFICLGSCFIKLRFTDVCHRPKSKRSNSTDFALQVAQCQWIVPIFVFIVDEIYTANMEPTFTNFALNRLVTSLHSSLTNLTIIILFTSGSWWFISEIFAVTHRDFPVLLRSHTNVQI